VSNIKENLTLIQLRIGKLLLDQWSDKHYSNGALFITTNLLNGVSDVPLTVAKDFQLLVSKLTLPEEELVRFRKQ
jgi:hypothetical protein